MSYTGTYLDKWEDEYPEEHEVACCQNCSHYNSDHEIEDDAKGCPGDIHGKCDEWRYAE